MAAMRKLQSGRSVSVMIMLSGAAAVHMPIAPRSGKLVFRKNRPSLECSPIRRQPLED
jgi:hypothetical protein